jgi:hypothetical protein
MEQIVVGARRFENIIGDLTVFFKVGDPYRFGGLSIDAVAIGREQPGLANEEALPPEL